MKPLNPTAPGPINLSLRRLVDPGFWDEINSALAEAVDEDAIVHLEWTNATITARAGTVRAWIDLSTQEHP